MKNLRIIPPFFLALVLCLDGTPAQNTQPDRLQQVLGESYGTEKSIRIPKGHVITRVWVRSGSRVDNIEFESRAWGRDSIPARTSWLGLGTGGTLRSFDIPPGDRLQKIKYWRSFWASNEAIIGIKFFTAKGIVSQRFGSSGQDRGTWAVLANSEAVGMTGWEVSSSGGGKFEGLAFIYRDSDSEYIEDRFADSNVKSVTSEFSMSPTFGRRIAAIEGRVISGKFVGFRLQKRHYDGTNENWKAWVGASSGGTVDRFSIAENDYLRKVDVKREDYTFSANGKQTTDKRIRAIRFTTHLGASMTFGTSSAVWPKNTTVKHGEILGLFGRTLTTHTAEYIRSIGVNYGLFGGSTYSRDSGCGTGATLNAAPTRVRLDGLPQPWNLSISTPGRPAALLFNFVKSYTSFGSCNIGVDLQHVMSLPVLKNPMIILVPPNVALIDNAIYWQAVYPQSGGPILGSIGATNLLESRIGAYRHAL